MATAMKTDTPISQAAHRVAQRIVTTVKQICATNDSAKGLCPKPSNLMLMKAEERFHDIIVARVQRDLNADYQVNAVSIVDGTHGSVAAVIEAAAEEAIKGQKALLLIGHMNRICPVECEVKDKPAVHARIAARSCQTNRGTQDLFARWAEEDQIAELTRWTLASVMFMSLSCFIELVSQRYPLDNIILLKSGI